MKQFNVIFSLMFLAGLTCSDNLFASKKDIKNLYLAIHQMQLTGKRPSINLDAKDEKGNTRLHRAARDGDVLEASRLIHAGAKIDLENRAKKTPLDLATENKHVNVQLLLQQHAVFFSLGDNTERVKFAITAITAGAYVCVKNRWGRTPLGEAASCNHKAFARLLLKNGAHVDQQDDDGRTPLLVAAQAGKLDIVQLLLDANACIDTRNESGNTPLHLAAYRNREEVVRLLINRGADQDLVNKRQQTPLAVAQEQDFLISLDYSKVIALLQG